jgi:geranylgeranyl transferase type-2 subunit beta
MSGMYWGLSAMYLLGRLGDMDKDAILAWVLRCQHPDGGFGGSERNDSHILYTLSAVQILALYDELCLVDAERVASCECGELCRAAGLRLHTSQSTSQT